MKRWDYNTLKGEVGMFALFIAFVFIELMSLIYILFFADIVCIQIAKDMDSLQYAVLMTWASRIIVALYMVVIAKGFHVFWKKQGNI